VRTKIFRDLYRGINEFKKSYQPDDLLADSYNNLDRKEN
jgi:hypothetical protein